MKAEMTGHALPPRRWWMPLLEMLGYQYMTSTTTPDSVDNARAYRVQTHWTFRERLLILVGGWSAVEVAVGDRKVTVLESGVPIERYEHAVIATDAVVLMPGTRS